MQTYILSTPKDDHGQPIRIFKANLENNVSKAIDQLSGICSGMLADGIVGDAEAKFFADYVRKFAGYEPVWPFTDILARVERIFTDGDCNDDEREELKTVMEALCGHVEQAKPEETYSATLPLDSPLPNPILFPERNFVVTSFRHSAAFPPTPHRHVRLTIWSSDFLRAATGPTPTMVGRSSVRSSFVIRGAVSALFRRSTGSDLLRDITLCSYFPARAALFLCVPEPRVVLRSTIRNSSDRPEPWAARLSAPLGDIAPAMQFVDPVLESLAMANTDRATTRAP